MPRPRFLIALVAVVMLMIGGAPARADAAGCDPCPPDCPMMKALANAAAEHRAGPAKGQPVSENPCKPSPLCQVAVQASAPAPVADPIAYPRFAVAVRHAVANGIEAPSRPPDRNLRPPIQL